jgi:hypothetical protein
MGAGFFQEEARFVAESGDFIIILIMVSLLGPSRQPHP